MSTKVWRIALREHLEKFVPDAGARREISKLIGKYTADAIREDRKSRKPTSEMAHLMDVFFNGREAR